MSEFSTLPDLNITSGNGELELSDITTVGSGYILVSVEVSNEVGECECIFLDREEVTQVRDWCNRVLKGEQS
ncbi:MAG: hypothetical protein WCD76_16900 [Pyrinomonadaceae bacterium]